MFCGECGTESTDQASFCPVCGHDLTLQRAQSTRSMRSTGAVSSTDDLPRSGFWRRFAALLIDSVIIWVMFVPARFIFFDLGLFSTQVAILAYYVVGTTVWGRTLGKAALGIRVVGPDGTPPGIGRTLMRETLGKFLSAILLMIGFLMAAGKQKLALHDRISGTRVEISPTNWRKRGNLT